MTLPAPIYDLVLLLDSQAEETTRAKIVADARAAIEAQGEFLRHDDWGDRTLSYLINRKADAEYHLLQFHAGAPELLGTLDRTLRITDGILRFRIIKLKPGVPDAPEMLATQAVVEQPQTAVEPEVGVLSEAVVEAGLETAMVLETEAVVEAPLEVEAVVETEAATATDGEGDGDGDGEGDGDGGVSAPA
jgi:small subunit ribosomal protein S6